MNKSWLVAAALLVLLLLPALPTTSAEDENNLLLLDLGNGQVYWSEAEAGSTYAEVIDASAAALGLEVDISNPADISRKDSQQPSSTVPRPSTLIGKSTVGTAVSGSTMPSLRQLHVMPWASPRSVIMLMIRRKMLFVRSLLPITKQSGRSSAVPLQPIILLIPTV